MAKGSSAYQAVKAKAQGTGRQAVNAVPSRAQQRQVSVQGSPGRARQVFGRPARGLTKGYVK